MSAQMSEILFQPERRKSLLQSFGSRYAQLTDRNQAELAFSRGVRLRRMDAMMRNVVDASFDAIITLNDKGCFQTANPAALQIFGYSLDELLTLTPQEIFSEYFKMPALDSVSTLEAFLKLGRGPHETTGRRANGDEVPLELSVSETQNDEGVLYVVIVRDITERKAQDEELRHQALHDALTGLPNRVLLSDRLAFALESAQRTQQPMALLLLDLDRFKEVNDTLGHQVGDEVLIEVSKRLRQAIRTSDTIARLGGDEFAALLPAVTDLPNARMVAERIQNSLGTPLAVTGDINLDVGVSVGIALFPEHAGTPVKLMQCADIAMYAAKRGQLSVALYDEGKDSHSVRHLTLTGELRRAIEQKKLHFCYQPKIDIASRRVVSVEALARWTHPEFGEVPPDEFVLHAERTGLIDPLSRWCFGAAFAQIKDWQKDGLDLSVAVNLSVRNLLDENLPNLLKDLLESEGVSARSLVLEITESAIMNDPETAMSVIQRLSDMGIRLSIDDFGTGYSSLAYLRRLPVKELKIDQSFVTGMLSNEADMVIVRSTIDLAHNLGLEVVAEGVELPGHVDVLRDLGCDFGQGYHIGRPMRGEVFKEWLEASEWLSKDVALEAPSPSPESGDAGDGR